MYACMYCMRIYVCVHASRCTCMYVYMHVYIHVFTYVSLKLGFERYGRGKCPSWEGELSGGELFGGIVRRELSVGIVRRMSVIRRTHDLLQFSTSASHSPRPYSRPISAQLC